MGFSKAITRWRHCADVNPRGFVETKLRIPDIYGREVPFTYKWAQREFSDSKQYIIKRGEPVRLWVGKWRRAGLSAICSAEGFSESYGRTNHRRGIIAHQESRAAEILENYKRFYETLRIRHPELILPLAKDNIQGMRWGAGTNSQVLIATAENPIKVRGDGLIAVDMTEAAHFLAGNFNKVLKEVCPVVPPGAGSSIVAESTGSFVGSEPYEHYMGATRWEDYISDPRGKLKGDNEFIRRFLCWLDDPTEREPFANDAEMYELMEHIREKEPRLAEKNAHYKLTPEQIKVSWRMFHMQSKNDFEYFCREFPYTEAEMWSAGGDSFFGSYELSKVTPRPPIEAYRVPDHMLSKIIQNFDDLEKLDPTNLDPYSRLPIIKLWAGPNRNDKYLLGSDHASGVLTGDATAGYMLNKVSRRTMASYHGWLRPDESAYLNVSLCRMFNNAVSAPELNIGGGGSECINVMQRLNYWNIYVYKRRDGVAGVSDTRYLGWWTDARTRPVMFTSMRQLFLDVANTERDTGGIFVDAHLLHEMRTFGTDPKTGIPRANANCYDDRVCAWAIANQASADEVYCTRDDLVRQAHRMDNLTSKPLDPASLVGRAKSPKQVMDSIMNPNSNFMKNKWEI